MRIMIIGIGLLFIICFAGCGSRQTIDITPHVVNIEADFFYRQALSLSSYYDIDSTKKCLNLLDKALQIDSLNPDYYGMKAKLLAELGFLDSALTFQTLADNRNAITGEYLFQLGLFQAAKGMAVESHESFKRSNDFLEAVLNKYPDSLEAFIIQQAANSLYYGNDSLFMNDIVAIRKRFPDRLMEIEMARRLKPRRLIKQIKDIEMDVMINDLNHKLDSLIEKTENNAF